MGFPKMILLLTFDNVFMEKNRFEVKRRNSLFHPLMSLANIFCGGRPGPAYVGGDQGGVQS